jgi:hypothetical protein
LRFIGTSKSKIGHPVVAAGAHARRYRQEARPLLAARGKHLCRRNTGFTFRKPY